MNGIISSLAASIMQPLRQSMWRGGRVVMLVLTAVAFMIVALGFAVAAVWSWLGSLYGPTTAAWVVAASFVLLATVALAIASGLRGSGQLRPVANRQVDGLATLGDGPSARQTDLVATCSELASLAAVMAARNRLKPWELVSLAVLTGFLLARRNGRSKSS